MTRIVRLRQSHDNAHETTNEYMTDRHRWTSATTTTSSSRSTKYARPRRPTRAAAEGTRVRRRRRRPPPPAAATREETVVVGERRSGGDDARASERAAGDVDAARPPTRAKPWSATTALGAVPGAPVAAGSGSSVVVVASRRAVSSLFPTHAPLSDGDHGSDLRLGGECDIFMAVTFFFFSRHAREVNSTGEILRTPPQWC